MKEKSEFNKWIKSILISIIIASVIRWGTIENFKIPTSSMEGTLLTGDIVAVSKLHYGPRIPITPLQIPLTHQKIWNIKTYSNFLKLPYFRLFGFSKIKRGDKVVFNNPIELWYPIDLKTYFIKRCIGLPGDELKIEKGDIFINNKLYKDPKGIYNKYYLKSTKLLNDQFFFKNKIQNYTNIDLNQEYLITTTSDIASNLSKYDFIKIKKQIIPKEVSISGIYGNNYWNVDFYGPIIIPKKGMKIKIIEKTLSIYLNPIKYYERNKNVEIIEGKLLINNQIIETYTFKQNYYFMIGDNRHNSRDSRFSGFIPEDHILGKAVMVLFSFDNQVKGNIFKKIRWNRILRIFN